jgi:signal transduction histidine kinase
MRLSLFIRTNMESILQEWEDFARSIQPAHRAMDVAELRDHAKEMLEEIADELAASEHDEDGQVIQSMPGMMRRARAAEIHAETRLTSGFNIEQLVSEYRALRASVLRLWSNRKKTATWFEVEDMARFNEAIDQSLAESVGRYSLMVNRSQDIFLGILGHDLRTPLQSLTMGAAYLMSLDSPDSNLIQLGARMYRSTSRMGHILNNLLDFTMSRVGGGLPLKIKQANLADISEQIADEFRFSHPNRTIKTDVRGQVEGIWDTARLGQVYQNLIANALQYGSENGTVYVLTTEVDEHVRIVVHNDGEPIPDAMKDSLFDPLFRHAKRETEEASRKNLGLGLYIVREIVLAHGGTIDVTSSKRLGTNFTVLIPKRHPLQDGAQAA